MVFPSPAIAIANGSVPTTPSRCSGSYRREIVPSAKGAESSRASHHLFDPSLTHIADRRPAVHLHSSSRAGPPRPTPSNPPSTHPPNRNSIALTSLPYPNTKLHHPPPK